MTTIPVTKNYTTKSSTLLEVAAKLTTETAPGTVEYTAGLVILEWIKPGSTPLLKGAEAEAEIRYEAQSTVESPFEAGDTVQLKSGGPLMTVEGHRSSGRGYALAACVWISGDEVVRKDLAVHTLKSAEVK